MKLKNLWSELNRLSRVTRDVALVSHPKSGRTWLRFMLNAANVNIVYDHAGADNRMEHRFEEISSRPAEWSKWRVIFLFRDPRDTAVSSYFQSVKRMKEQHKFTGDIHAFIRDPRFGIERIAKFNLRWLESASTFRDFTSVRYEEMHQDARRELFRVIAFATGKTPDCSLVEHAVAEGRFENMQKVELQFGAHMDDRLRLGGGNPGDPESLKTRRGKVNGWLDYLTERDVAYTEAVLAELDYWNKVSILHRPQSGVRRDSRARSSPAP